jgi:hypothetical protein
MERRHINTYITLHQEANEVNELRARFMLFDVYYLSFVSVYSRLKEEGGEQ